MKNSILILLSLFLLFSCSEQPKKYTIVLEAYRGFENEKKIIEAINDSIAYQEALMVYYGAKIAAKKYKLSDKYAYVNVYNENGNSLSVTLSSKVIDNIKEQLGRLPNVKEIQDDDNRFPEF